MPAVFRNGGLRLMALLGLGGFGYYVVFVAGGNALRELLWRIEHITHVPGLSGLFLLFMSPLAFLAVCFAVDWVAAGFREVQPRRD